MERSRSISSDPLILSQGYRLEQITLPPQVLAAVRARDWPGLDRAIAREVVPGGVIFERLAKFASFTQIEFIISIRSSREYPDDDGIWHDDGSRVLAFSLSLTEKPEQIEGGRLEVRRRAPEAESSAIPTPPFGTMIVFATGQLGFEHKINRVAQGERIIIAGWCT